MESLRSGYGNFLYRLALRPADLPSGGAGRLYRTALGRCFSYQLAVAVDDALMGVTRVVRARDLMPSAARQICLLRLLDLPEPAYAHGPLLVPHRPKSFQAGGALNMLYFRRQYSPRELCGLLAYLCGLRASIQPLTPAELLPDFAWERVSRKDILLPSRLAFPPESSRH